MLKELESLETEAVLQIDAAEDLKDLNDLRVKYLGKKRSDDRNHETNGEIIE